MGGKTTDPLVRCGEAADACGRIGREMNYLLNDLTAVFGNVMPWMDKMERWAEQLFDAARIIREAVTDESAATVRRADESSRAVVLAAMAALDPPEIVTGENFEKTEDTFQ